MKTTVVRDEASPVRKQTDSQAQERPKKNRPNQSGIRPEHRRLADDIWNKS